MPTYLVHDVSLGCQPRHSTGGLATRRLLACAHYLQTLTATHEPPPSISQYHRLPLSNLSKHAHNICTDETLFFILLLVTQARPRKLQTARAQRGRGNTAKERLLWSDKRNRKRRQVSFFVAPRERCRQCKRVGWWRASRSRAIYLACRAIGWCANPKRTTTTKPRHDKKKGAQTPACKQIGQSPPLFLWVLGGFVLFFFGVAVLCGLEWRDSSERVPSMVQVSYNQRR